MAEKKAYFQNVWLNASKFPDFAGWLKPDKDDKTKFQVLVLLALVHTTLNLSQKTEPKKPKSLNLLF